MPPQILTEHERTVLYDFRANGTPAEARRAEIVLLVGDDVATADIAGVVGLSTSQVRHWRREWEKRGLDIFPTAEAAEPSADEEQPAEAAAAEPAPEPEPRPGVDMSRLPLVLADTVGLAPDDPMVEAGRKVLYFHFERMLLNEPGSRLGEDIEAIHDMRVATRRMRSALRLFGPFFVPRKIKRFRKRLRSVASTLGEVRDLDVAIEKATRFATEQPDLDLSGLMAMWHKRHDKARRALIADLDSKSFARFVDRFHTFLTTPGKGAPPEPAPGEAVAYQLRHVAPRLVYEHFEKVRAYETVLNGAPVAVLHALRIDFKRLRYTLEFFAEVLGPEVREVIKDVKTIQDHLGDLNDSDVVLPVLLDFITRHNQKYSGVPQAFRPDIAGVVAYSRAVAAERQRLLDTFAEVWAHFNRDDTRRNLALAVAVL
jgi:CHAD domain-containing protein